ncbi:hypothetical protein M514_02592, partial [Trichuris suis]
MSKRTAIQERCLQPAVEFKEAMHFGAVSSLSDDHIVTVVTLSAGRNNKRPTKKKMTTAEKLGRSVSRVASCGEEGAVNEPAANESRRHCCLSCSREQSKQLTSKRINFRCYVRPANCQPPPSSSKLPVGSLQE